MEFVIIGAGLIGSAVVRELADHDAVRAIRVCDAHARALQDLANQVSSPKLVSYQLDARDRLAVAPILAGASCTIGAGSPALSLTIAQLAVEAGSHFCDLGGPDSVLGAELGLHDVAKAAGRWIIPGCGLAPGLANMLCMHGIEQFDQVEHARIRVGDIPRDPVPPFNFQVAWSAEKLLEDYTEPVQIIRNGAVEWVEPLGGDEVISFEPPFDRLEAFYTAGSLSLLARQLSGRVENLDYKTVRWPGHAEQMRFLLGLGFGERRSIDVRTHLTYRDLLIRRLRQRLAQTGPDTVLLRVEIEGQKNGHGQSLVMELIEGPDESAGLSAMKRCTAIPTAAVALLLASGAIPGGGAAPPESIVPYEPFAERVTERGLQIHTRWRDL